MFRRDGPQGVVGVAGVTENGPRSSHRHGTAARTTALLLLTAGVGFALGALTADGERRWWSGTVVAAIASVVAAVTLAAVWRRETRRARRFGLSTGQLFHLARDVRRGTPPTDPAARPAVLELLGRQRRALGFQRHKGYRRARTCLIILFSLLAVVQLASGSYGSGALTLLWVLFFLLGPLTLRRQERRLDAAERSLGLPAQSPPD
ncbi:hypothetical protein SAM40697_3700 [Streptomyces ambofaciens]|uniref:Integral membrane protein n=1 Tax=Streptomyces ambofaciens TaxID=1889 RepID=A0ABN4PBM7_STRAM|nr:hypothetical protein SAM40697_3700 [Streptomyces ambofaciens]